MKCGSPRARGEKCINIFNQTDSKARISPTRTHACTYRWATINDVIAKLRVKADRTMRLRVQIALQRNNSLTELIRATHVCLHFDE